MKKRTYRAKKVNQVNVPKLQERLAGQAVVLGVDIAKKDLYGAIMLATTKQVVLLFKWNQLRESSQFLNLLRSARDAASSLEVALEPSGTYGDPLRAQVAGMGLIAYRVSPKRSKDYAEVYDGVPSQHDGKSAVLVARLHADGISERWRQQSDAERTLSASVSKLELYSSQHWSTLNRIESQLGRYWPELTQDLALDSVTLMRLLATYGSPAAVASAGSEAAETMRKAGRYFLKEEKIALVLRSARSTIGKTMVEAERALVMELAEEALRLHGLERESRKEVKRLTREMVSVSALTPLLGSVTAAVVVVKAGDPRSYTSTSSWVKNLGLNLKERSSGRYTGQLRITKRGSATARRWLYMFVLRLLRQDAVVRAWYEKKVARDGKLKKKALIAVMRKVAASLPHVARGEAFDATKLFDVRRLSVS